MRVMLKIGRCLRKSYLFVIIWIFGFLLISLNVVDVSFSRKSAIQGRFSGRKTASVDNMLDTSAAKEKDSPNDQLSEAGENFVESETDIAIREIQKRIVNSRAGNFTYVSRGDNSVYDSSRGQFSVIDRYLNQKEHGFFVELGTEGNEPNSLTFLLERSRGWTGLVIEPEADKFQSLMQMKRNSKFLQTCINVRATVEEWPANGSSEIPCTRIADILKAIKRNKIDLLVFDVTGQETQLLTSFPFQDIDVRMINIEIHGINTPVIQITNELKTQFESVQLMINHIYRKTDMIFLNKQTKP